MRKCDIYYVVWGFRKELMTNLTWRDYLEFNFMPEDAVWIEILYYWFIINNE